MPDAQTDDSATGRPKGAPAQDVRAVRIEIYISFTSEDRAAAMRLKAGLEAAGLDVWLDQKKLQAGDTYEGTIKQAIGQCCAFLPLISKHTESRSEGFFRKEWYWALERLRYLTGAGLEFLTPVAIDDIPPQSAMVPEEFKNFHWARAPGGIPQAELVDRLRAIVHNARLTPL